MQFSIPKLFSTFLFLSLAAADLHESCTCHNGDSYNWRITTKACEIYNEAAYQWGGAVYDTPSGRCTKAGTDDRLAGDQWEAACQSIAESGFDCADGQGTCYASPDDVKGSC
ncbi:hypothetical protein B0J13DRAFT_611570 [Dactylonectria estremocensis]|uniref:Uncharacterized protein n=1 Tax=Dactylonectria estremocensis TaxID=1079267 RepID=A0A9P9E105_9HYPO|nr:hypothetical protein B0J13DRAFT_611570 [Dactylonectria estremocensis]